MLKLIFVVLLLTLLPGCSKLTMENFDKINRGMSYSQVTEILGKPDSCSDVVVARTCIWGDEKKNITVNFIGGKAVLYTSTNIK